MKKNETRLPERLKALRENTSQAKIASLFGVKQPTYSSWELGRKEPSLGIVCDIAKHYGVTTDYLLGVTDSRGPGIAVTATDHSIAASNSTVRSDSAETARLLSIIESQQRVIERLAGDRS